MKGFFDWLTGTQQQNDALFYKRQHEINNIQENLKKADAAYGAQTANLANYSPQGLTGMIKSAGSVGLVGNLYGNSVYGQTGAYWNIPTVGSTSPGYTVTTQQALPYVPSPTEKMIGFDFIEVNGDPIRILVDEAYVPILEQINQMHKMAKHFLPKQQSIMPDNEFDLEELERATELMEALNGDKAQGTQETA